ncbi:thioredoxin-dependent thiol peroxidase [Chitinophaga lutea]
MKHLKPGDKAPAFSAADQLGNRVSLADFKGRKVILYFYPHDLSPTCTVQACNLRDNYGALLAKGYVVLGVSEDDVKKHQRFADRNSLPFPLLADTDRKMLNDYGVWGEKKFMGRIFDGTHRTTFLIDEKGRIAHIIDKPVSADQAAQVIALWEGEAAAAPFRTPKKAPAAKKTTAKGAAVKKPVAKKKP